jgi:hypothetical protein
VHFRGKEKSGREKAQNAKGVVHVRGESLAVSMPVRPHRDFTPRDDQNLPTRFGEEA